MAKQITVAVIILGAGILGFFLFDDLWRSFLWLIFMIAAYPPALAFTVAGRLPAASLVEIYKIGVSQIPILSQAFGLAANEGIVRKPRPGGSDKR